jgi:hypothetical protein
MLVLVVGLLGLVSLPFLVLLAPLFVWLVPGVFVLAGLAVAHAIKRPRTTLIPQYQ